MTKRNHVLCRLTHSDIKSRRLTYRLSASSLQGRIQDVITTRCVNGSVYAELIGLYAGEFIPLQNGFHFRILRGAVELNGHVYTPGKIEYSKHLIPPWSPPERMLALCTGRGRSRLKRYQSNRCFQCSKIMMDHLLGGTCCTIMSRLSKDEELVKRHFNIAVPRRKTTGDRDDIDSEIVDYYDYNGPLKDPKVTVIAFIQHISAFGTIDIKRTFACGKRFKIVPVELRNAASELLNICVKGEKPPVLMLHGDKSSGKSTSVTHIVNYLLNHVPTVAVLDTDVGQPIFGPLACVSLKFVTDPITMPPHSLASESPPDVVRLVGDVKVTNPTLLMSHIEQMVSMYNKCVEDDRSIPLVVNAFGWVTGMGAKLMDSIAAATNASIILKLNTKYMNGVTIPPINTHAQFEKIIVEHMSLKPEEPETKTEAMPIYETIMEAHGVKVPWDRSKCTIIEMLSHSQVTALIHAAVDSITEYFGFEEGSCTPKAWQEFQRRKNLTDPMPDDLRWLRACVLLNPAFGEAIHFPQLQHEEFFGSVTTPEFHNVVRNPELFKPPKQRLLLTQNCSFVLRITSNIDKIEEICPVIAGSVVALCKGQCDRPFYNEISPDWEFLEFVYAHYLNPEDMTLLISHHVNINREKLQEANIVVLCQTIGFDTLPNKLCIMSIYPSVDSPDYRLVGRNRPRELSGTQFVPFRRNNLLHMVNVQGSGNSAGSSRKNIKRHKYETVNQ